MINNWSTSRSDIIYFLSTRWDKGILIRHSELIQKFSFVRVGKPHTREEEIKKLFIFYGRCNIFWHRFFEKEPPIQVDIVKVPTSNFAIGMLFIERLRLYDWFEPFINVSEISFSRRVWSASSQLQSHYTIVVRIFSDVIFFEELQKQKWVVLENLNSPFGFHYFIQFQTGVINLCVLLLSMALMQRIAFKMCRRV